MLFGIGVGPGGPELMTLKAVRTALACDVIALPHKDPAKCLAWSIALGAAPELSEKPLLPVDMPMTKDAEALEAAYTAAADAVQQQLDQGKCVAFLTLGDPTVYSTYLYVHRKIQERGYATELVPGVTSFCAAAATLNRGLCENSQELHVIPGTYNAEEALDYPGTKVIMKNNLPATLEALKERGLDACMVERCGLPEQRVFEHAADIPADAGYFSVLIVPEQE